MWVSWLNHCCVKLIFKLFNQFITWDCWLSFSTCMCSSSQNCCKIFLFEWHSNSPELYLNLLSSHENLMFECHVFEVFQVNKFTIVKNCFVNLSYWIDWIDYSCLYIHNHLFQIFQLFTSLKCFFLSNRKFLLKVYI